MKKKPRWMQSVIEAAKEGLPMLPTGRRAAGDQFVAKSHGKSSLAKA